MTTEREKINAHNRSIKDCVPLLEQSFCVHGYSIVAQKQVDFLCDFMFSSGFPNVNWRERLVCPESKFNNRMRLSIHIIESLANLKSSSCVYLMEQITPLYKYLSAVYPNLTGSEYLGKSIPLGSVNAGLIRNEDATRLTFCDRMFDAILSYDVFEHIPDFKNAFRECHRILKPGGRMVFSAPFDPNSDKTLIRAIVSSEGEITHLLEPEYHGDPIARDDGILCYQRFGWDLMEDLNDAGFSDAYAILGWSFEFGYFTPQIQFLAVK
jgi:SAM-dependent methyltransferase